MASPVVALFCTPERGHFQLLVPLLTGLARRGFAVHVFTDQRFARRVSQAGGVFVDLFGRYSIDAADAESLPVPCRFVTFAGRYADDVRHDLEAIRPALVVYETFSVVGRVVAALLDIPSVNVSPGHNLEPARFLRQLQADSRVRVSTACRQAVDVLRDRQLLPDASPFAYVTGVSRALNICCEPPAFLTEEERRAFEPLEFYGSLPAVPDALPSDGRAWPQGWEGTRFRVYVSFGRTIWRYYAREARLALGAIARCLARRSDACALVSLAGAPEALALAGEFTAPNIVALPELDQWQVLAESNVFVTHHGINSTHEAIAHRVPMISYPFFWDQPGLAAKCHALGIALPLAPSVRGEVRDERLDAALEAIAARSGSLDTNLERAWRWERETVAGRDLVLQRIADLL